MPRPTAAAKALHRSTLAAAAALRDVVPMFPCNSKTGAIPVVPLTAREAVDLAAHLGWPIEHDAESFRILAPGGVRVVGSIRPEAVAL